MKINRALSFNNPALLGDKGALLRGGKCLKNRAKIWDMDPFKG